MSRRGLAVMFWALLFSAMTTMAVRLAGLKYVQGVVWPSDLYAFQQAETGPLDVLVLGSSRASFALPPSALDSCLEQEIGRPTHSVNLARTFTTATLAHRIVEDLLRPETRPQLLVLAIGPEFFDERNHRQSVNVASSADLADIPGSLVAARDLPTLLAALRPLARGSETLGLYLSGRWRSQPGLRWMMLHHGGGQFCFGHRHCDANNAALSRSLASWWVTAMDVFVPALERERFSHYTVGAGPVHRHMLQLARWARENDAQLVLVDLPRHAEFEDRLPSQVRSDYASAIDRLVQDHGAIYYDGTHDPWPDEREYYVDIEHLNARGAQVFSKEACQDLLAPLLRARDGREGGT